MSIFTSISPWFLPLITAEGVAYNAMQSYIQDNKQMNLVLSVGSFALIPFCLYKMLKEDNNMAMTNTIWNVTSAVYGVGIGVLFFGEEFTQTQLLGVMLGIGSIVLVTGSL